MKELIKKNVLVIGLGSIGERHVRNLKKLGCKSIFVLRRKNNKPRTIDLSDYRFVSTLDESLDHNIDAAIIANPSSHHTELLEKLVLNKIPVLLEVPISDKLDRLQKISENAKKNFVPILVGHNIKFHPSLKKIFELIECGELCDVSYSRSQFGEYLPDCHPWGDYKTRYEARADLGGGVILTSIHEIDHAIWLLGEVKSVTCIMKTLNLDIDVEDTAMIILEHKSGALSEITLDFIQRVYTRNLQICAGNGTIEWALKNNNLKFFNATTKKWKNLISDEFYDFNETYIEELLHFSDIIYKKDEPITSLDHSIHVLNVALSAKKSSELKKTIYI
mgnify:CR=1 FL=1|jgi:predicted dehydrogenase